MTITIQCSLDELEQRRPLLIELLTEVGRTLLPEMKDLLAADDPIPQNAFMKLAGYKDHGAFKAFCERNKIVSCGVRARQKYYLPSQLDKVQMPKGNRK